MSLLFRHISTVSGYNGKIKLILLPLLWMCFILYDTRRQTVNRSAKQRKLIRHLMHFLRRATEERTLEYK